MALANFRTRQRIRLDGVTFELAGRLPSGHWQLIDVDTGLRDDQPDDVLWQAYLTHHLHFVLTKDEGNRRRTELLADVSAAAEVTPFPCSNAQLDAALLRQRYLQEIDALRGLVPLKDAIDAVWIKLGRPSFKPKLRTVQYWRKKACGATDPIAALVAKWHAKGNRTSRYPAAVVEIVDHVIHDRYLKRSPRLTIQKTVEIVGREVRRENQRRPPSEGLPVPGRRLVKTRLRFIPEGEQIAKRYGRDAALAALRTSMGGIATTQALERAEVDHTLLAIVLLDDDFMPWGRASASMCLDVHTRCPTGLYMGAEVPSIVSVAHCLERSVLPKCEWLSHFPDVQGRWDCYGVHKTYVLDNGLEEHAAALRHALSELGGSTAEFCPRKAPWYKPHVERYFRTQDVDLLQTLPGCTGENISVRPAFDPKKDALLTKRTFENVYMQWLVDIYLRKPQEVLGNISPIEAWKRSITLEDQSVPTRRVLLERLFLRKERHRLLDHAGIEFDCLIYNSADMGALRVQLGAKLKVDIWVSDEDLGYIYVDVPGQDISIRVPCLDQHYASGTTRWQHRKCKAMRRIGRDEGLQLSFDATRDRIAASIEADAAERLHARRKRRTRYAASVTPISTGKRAIPPSDARVQSQVDTRSSAADDALMCVEQQIPALGRIWLSHHDK